MKYCNQCRQTYFDDTLNFCLADGTVLVDHPDAPDATLVLPGQEIQSESARPRRGVGSLLTYLAIALVALIAGGGIVYFMYQRGDTSPPSKPSTEASGGSAADDRQRATPTPAPKATPTGKTGPDDTKPPLEERPVADYAILGVRAGTADGKRLRVVVDMIRTAGDKGPPVKYETLDPGGAEAVTRILVLGAPSGRVGVKYESKQAQKLGTVTVSPSERGLEIRVVPGNRLFLSEVFQIPGAPPNLKDRLVIDLCLTATCPSLR